MTATFHARAGGSVVSVNILPDGDLEFPGFDPEYQLAMEEFGEPRSPVFKIAEFWEDRPEIIIIEHSDFSDENTVLLFADYAEYVLPIYMKIFKNDTMLMDTINGARQWARFRQGSVSGALNIFDKELWDSIESLVAVMMKNISNRYGLQLGDSINRLEYVLLSVLELARAVRNFDTSYDKITHLTFCARYAASAGAMETANVKSDDKSNLLYREAEQAAKDWQKRRFHDVLEAMSEDRAWPPLEATP